MNEKEYTFNELLNNYGEKYTGLDYYQRSHCSIKTWKEEQRKQWEQRDEPYRKHEDA